MKHNYTYHIKELDIVSGQFIVKYTPLNTALLSVEYALPGVVAKDDASPMTIEEIIESAAPHNLWTSQEFLLAQYSTLKDKIGTINNG